MSEPRTLVVGIGSSHGDDRAGWEAVQIVRRAVDRNRVVVRQAASPAQLLDWLGGVERLIVCDACRTGGCAGELRRWSWPLPQAACGNWSAAHGLALPAALQLADRLGRLPRSVAIWTVEGSADSALAAMSPAVAASLSRLAEKIVCEIENDLTSSGAECTNSR